MPSGKKVPPQIRERIIELKKEGLTHGIIAKRVGLSRSMVSRLIRRSDPNYTPKRIGPVELKNICNECLDMPHARPQDGCPECGSPHREEVLKPGSVIQSSAGMALR